MGLGGSGNMGGRLGTFLVKCSCDCVPSSSVPRVSECLVKYTLNKLSSRAVLALLSSAPYISDDIGVGGVGKSGLGKVRST